MSKLGRLLVLWLCAGAAPSAWAATVEDLDALVAAYPAAIERHDGQNIYWRDGTVMPVGRADPDKPFSQRLKDASISDQFYLQYPAGKDIVAPPLNFDPGRFRNEAFFRKLYGDCRSGDVARHLKSVPWFPDGHSLKVTELNGVAGALGKVSAEINKLPDAIQKAAYPIAGTLSCRAVADTGRMSMHAYGAAIDLNLAYSDYWLWHAKPKSKYRNRMPREIVDVFERHGFIWGGRWYHFDTMHFEYRPELLPRTAR